MTSITVVTPSRNEEPNAFALVESMPPEVGQIIFADDSDDDTPKTAVAAGVAFDRRVDVVHRGIGQRAGGLGGAVIAGSAIAEGDWIVVMDADGQHPWHMAHALAYRGELMGYDLVVGTRYANGGSPGAGLDGPWRRFVSAACTRLAKRMFPAALEQVTDPMSGLFAVRREYLAAPSFAPQGYKILLELLIAERALNVGEVGYTFQPRYAGESKAALPEGFRFLRRLRELRHAKVDRSMYQATESELQR